MYPQVERFSAALAVAVATAGTHRDSYTAAWWHIGRAQHQRVHESNVGGPWHAGEHESARSEAVVETFRDFSRSTKVTIWVMLALGAVLFAVCLIADLTEDR